MASNLIEQINQWDTKWATHFPKRVSRRQKQAFIAELTHELTERGFECEEINKWQFVRCTNLVTKCELPRVIFMAHYDTPTIIPFWFSWLFKLIGHTRQVTGMFIIIALLFLPFFLGLPITAVNFIFIIFYLSLLTFLIPNPHNREDNTSGIIGLMAIAEWLKDKPQLRQHVQLVITDNEELGLLGSSSLKSVWNKNKHPYKNASIINLDCISRGEVPLLVYHKENGLTHQLMPYIQRHLPNTYPIDMTFLPLSDNFTFRQLGAVNISFADTTIIPGGYYIPKIHVPSDNDFQADKMYPLIQGLTDYLADTLNSP